MSPAEYQAKLLAAYYEQRPRVEAQNRKLRWTVAILLVVGTIQWVAYLCR